MNEAPPLAEHRALLGDRSLFPNLKARAYLNHAALSPPSVAVEGQIAAAVKDFSENAVGGFMRWLPQQARLKSSLAAMIGAEFDEIAFVPNTTTGVIQVAWGLDWKPGDRVLLFTGEFPANVTPWQQAAETFGLELVFVPLTEALIDVGPLLERVEAVLRDGVRLLAVSAVQFQTGLTMPLKRLGQLCREYDCEVFVDAIQGLGVIPIDVARDNIHYLSCGGQKWLMGPMGTGFVYLRDACVKSMVPRLAGWLSHEASFDFLFLGPGHLRYDREIRRQANFVEAGTTNTYGYVGLEASVELIRQLGPSSIFAHLQSYFDRLEPLLVDAGMSSLRANYPQGQSGILATLPPKDVDVIALAKALNQAGVAVTTPDGSLRFAPHWPNALREVDDVAQTVVDTLRAMRMADG